MAIRRYRQLKRAGMPSVSIFAVDHGIVSRLSPSKLNRASKAEPREPRQASLRARKVIASALLGVLASALPNSIGDIGVVPTWDTLRATRNSQLIRRRKLQGALPGASPS